MTITEPEGSADTELLRRHLTGAEPDAFARLVERHLPMVLGAARRQTDGDAAAAEDIAQEVFVRLAQQARRLTHHSCLAGWCFVTTRNVSLTHQRSLTRRQHRELLAAMTPPPDSVIDWNGISPLLDEAITELPETDREAVLWRYFQQQTHSEIGNHLGVSANAARMRVDRALDRLRVILERRGITSTSTALGIALGHQVLAEPPVGLVERIAARASVQSPAMTGTGVSMTSLVQWLAHPARLAFVAVSLGGFLWWMLPPDSRRLIRVETAEIKPPGTASPSDDRNADASPGPATDRQPDGLAPTTEPAMLLLRIRNADGQTLTGVPLQVVQWSAAGVTTTELTNGPGGVARIVCSQPLQTLEVFTKQEGYADVRLRWRPERGDVIPAEYPLELEKGIRLGGRVLDENDEPMQGAEVRLLVLTDSGIGNVGPLSVLPRVTVTTDADGRWETRRLSEASLGISHWSVSAADHESASPNDPLRDPIRLSELRMGTHTVRMRPGRTLYGLVVNPGGNPVPGAQVFCGGNSADCDNCARTNTAADGSFVLPGVASIFETVYAEADGYALSSASITHRELNHRITIVLQPGRTLKMRLVDPQGNGIENVWFQPRSEDTAMYLLPDPLRSAIDGRVVWSNAPNFSVTGDFSAEGRQQRLLVPLTGESEEQVIRLDTPLVVSGAVRNRQTGELVPRFRLEPGFLRNAGIWRKPYGWFPGENADFNDDSYRYQISLVNSEAEAMPYVLRCSADGFSASVSRSITIGEGAVTVDFLLDPTHAVERWIVDSEGKPASQATVAPLTAESHVTLANGFLRAKFAENLLLTTDSQGRVTVPMWAGIERLAISAAAGFAMVSASEFESQQSITLGPWGRLEGHLNLAAHPSRPDRLQLGDGETFRLNPILGWEDSTASIDSAGHFIFDRVPSGTHPLFLSLLEGQRPGHQSRSQQFLRDVTVRAGETTTLSLDSPQRVVTARVRWADNVPPEWRAKARAQLRLPQARPPAGIVPGTTEWQDWFQKTLGGRPSRRSRTYWGPIDTEGNVRFTHVDTGHYEVHVKVVQQHPTIFNMEAGLATGSLPVSVPPEPSEEPLAAGEVLVEAVETPPQPYTRISF
ncbi:MAG: hypothetical protein RIS76_2515 [Verrucomicrobiota bacterium]|jgi:RNA polymerase sigma factor (sigma-70 family)